MDDSDKRHGTYAGAQTHWRTEVPLCMPCRLAARRYQKQRKTDTILNRPRRVDAAPVRQHLERLYAAGMTDGTVADKAGVSITAVRWARVGLNDSLLAVTAEAILGVHLAPGPTGLIPAVGARRRIQALAYIGWPMQNIADTAQNLGHDLTAAAVRYTAQGRGDYVRTATHNAISAAYDELSMRLPARDRSSSMVRSKARKAGYAGPLAWDDIDTDPAPRGLRNNATDAAAERAATLLEMVERGDNLTQAARALDVTPSTLHTWCWRNQMTDTYRKLANREGDWNSPGRLSREGAA